MSFHALPSDADLAEAVVRALAAVGIERPQAVYLFGSSVERDGGRVRPDSDVDLAFLGASPQDPVSVFDAAQALAYQLGWDVDLIDLRRASTVMRLQVLSRGRRLYCCDLVAVDTFEMYAYSDYARLQEERSETLRSFESAYRD